MRACAQSKLKHYSIRNENDTENFRLISRTISLHRFVSLQMIFREEGTWKSFCFVYWWHSFSSAKTNSSIRWLYKMKFKSFCSIWSIRFHDSFVFNGLMTVTMRKISKFPSEATKELLREDRVFRNIHFPLSTCKKKARSPLNNSRSSLCNRDPLFPRWGHACHMVHVIDHAYVDDRAIRFAKF